MANPWKSLEGISRLVALPAVWRRWLGTDFEIFQKAFLQRHAIAKSFPCPYDCGCWHRLPLQDPRHPVPDPQLLITAVCECNPPHCADLRLSLADVTLWGLNWSSLANALRKAFGFERKLAALGLPGTAQIGSWSADAVPVILTIQIDPKQFRATLAELVACVQKFILLAPTNQHMDANCQAVLARGQTALFALDTTVRLTDHGTLHSVKTPGELFAKFTPQPKDVEENVARRAFALIQQLDSELTNPPTPLTVFRMYCMEEMSASEIARECDCSKGTVIGRLNLIRAKTGVDPQDLRRLSAHLSKIEADITDPRAKHIHRKHLIDDRTEQDAEC